MRTSNAKQNFRSEDPIWVLLAEFSLSDFLSDHDRRDGLTAGYLFQTVRELGISPESMEKIARMLAGFAKEALARTKLGMPEFPGQIRIFCQKKILDDVTSAKTSRAYHPEHGKEHTKLLPDSGANTIGGWGYFMIERSENLSSSSALSHHSVDLYLYKEGEV